MTQELKQILGKLVKLYKIDEQSEETTDTRYQAFRMLRNEGYEEILDLLCKSGILRFRHDQNERCITFMVESVLFYEDFAMIDLENIGGFLTKTVPPPQFE